MGGFHLDGKTDPAIRVIIRREGLTNPDTNAIFLAKFDPSGKLLLARQWNSSGFETPAAVTVDACERAFVVVYTTGNLLGQSNGARDGFTLPVWIRQ